MELIISSVQIHSYPPIAVSLLTSNVLALSALSFSAYHTGIRTHDSFHLIPEGSFFGKSYPAYGLFHPVATSFLFLMCIIIP
jgi:hypothetical protein